MARPSFALCPALLFALALSSCQYLDRHETISLHGGDALASNVAIQMIDPWPLSAGDRHIPGDGERAAAAIERYRKNAVTEPQGLGASALSSGQGAQ